MTPLDQRISQSCDLINWLDEQIGAPNIPRDSRTHLSAACINLARQHHRAIVSLVEAKLYGSAAALLRVLWEAYLKSLWCYQVASEDQLQEFKNDRCVPFDCLITAIEKLPGYHENLRVLQKRLWKPLCSYTHTGYLALTKQMTTNSVEPTFLDEEIIGILDFSDAFAKFSVQNLATLCNDETFQQKFAERYA